jgi:hypothetical protein
MRISALRLLLILRVLIEFGRYDIVMRLRGFRAVHESLRRTSRRAGFRTQRVDCEMIAAAADTARLFYPHTVRCLQCAAVTARLMRRYGFAARFVIGYLPAPFLSHAWVEVNHSVFSTERNLNVKAFEVLDRL